MGGLGAELPRVWPVERGDEPSAPDLLRSVAAFAIRRTVRPFVGWAVAVSAYFLLIGVLADSITAFLTGNARFAELAAGAGFAGLGSVSGFAAAMFSLLGIPAGVYTAA